ncbi:MAG TPA: hypothetical protein PLI95_04955 [Polyangiaceae bacterium]|nr:hypothetical protein [Polyangiaceae bacterium]
MTSFPPPAAAHLQHWLTARGTTRFAFCIEAGLNPTLVWSWCSGRSVPSLRHALTIERVTGIAPREWLAPQAGQEKSEAA